MAITNEYDNGIYRRSWDNNNWVDFNDINEIHRRRWDNRGWEQGGAENGIVYRRRWDNRGWVQIYPKGIVVVEKPSIITATNVSMANYQEKYTSWTKNFARQGWVSVSGGGHQQFGLITLRANMLEGSGNITETGHVTFWGRTGASGNYNANNTISFRGTRHGSASGNPFSSHPWDPNPPFTFTWDSGGKNSPIPEGPVGGDKNTMLRWMNNVDGYGTNLCTYNGEGYNSTGWSRNYLSITNFNMKIHNYKYQAKRMLFDRPRSMPRFFSFAALSSVPKDENYLDIVVPENMTHITADQAIKMLNDETLREVKPSELISISESGIKPKIMQIRDGCAIVSHVPSDGVFVQYEDSKNMWNDCICVSPLTYKIPEGTKHIRLYDKETDEIFENMLL